MLESVLQNLINIGCPMFTGYEYCTPVQYANKVRNLCAVP